jgi:drug/metabolite transporter (DMT)-like permease
VSLVIAVGAGLGAAVAYGAATAGQHAAAYRGEVDPGGLAELLRDRRWLAATAGDVLGVILQIIALANGPVVLVQPLLIVALPVAVVLRPMFGGPRLSHSDLISSALVITALTGFFVLLGEPHRGRIIPTWTAVWVISIAVLAGLVAMMATRHRQPVARAVVFGMVAGCWFGVASVLIDAVSTIFQAEGMAGFDDTRGLVPLCGVVLLSVGGYFIVQVGFQVGPLGASFPANLILDPVVAVILGAALLGERVPLGGAKAIGYLICLVVVSVGAVRLAAVPVEPVGRAAQVHQSE